MAESNGNDWKFYAIRFAFGIVALLLPIAIGLAALTYSNLKADTKENFAEVKALIELRATQQQLLLTKQSDKLDVVCKRVDEHNVLLKMPYQQRKEFYSMPKMGVADR